MASRALLKQTKRPVHTLLQLSGKLSFLLGWSHPGKIYPQITAVRLPVFCVCAWLCGLVIFLVKAQSHISQSHVDQIRMRRH